MASAGIDIELIDTVGAVESALNDLRKCTKVAVDCEGVNLGRFGELCLVQIATNAKVYIFDVTELGGQIFDLGLKEFLEDADVIKLLYDCREDCTALKHQHNVQVRGIVDIQLMSVLGMKLEGAKGNFVFALKKSMQYFVPECQFDGAEKQRMHKAVNSDFDLWKRRPLKPEYLNYAAKDVFYLAKLEQRIIETKLYSIPSRYVLYEIIQYASVRYADFSRDNDKYGENKYFKSCWLPVNILPSLKYDKGAVIGYEDIVDIGEQCLTCNQFTGTDLDRCSRCLAIDHGRKGRQEVKM